MAKKNTLIYALVGLMSLAGISTYSFISEDGYAEVPEEFNIEQHCDPVFVDLCKRKHSGNYQCARTIELCENNTSINTTIPNP